MEVLTPQNIANYIQKNKPAEASYLIDLQDIQSKAESYLFHGLAKIGSVLPWDKTHDYFRMRPKEVTLWCGVNNQGKSLVTGMVAYSLAEEQPVLIASMEMQPSITYARMLRQACGGSNPTRQYLDKVSAKLRKNLIFFDKVGSINPEMIRNMISYAAQERGVKHFFIDSLMRCGFDINNNAAAREFMDMITTLAHDLNIHIHLIHHMKKMESVTDRVDSMSVKGAGELTDASFNVILIYRDMKKSQMKEENHPEYNPELPDCYIELVKQRNGDVTHKRFSFWWHQESTQWVTRLNGQPELFIKPWLEKK
jgi:twinkle protein